MIIHNGTIEFKVKTGGGMDPATGHPIASLSTWGDPIACQWVPNSNDNLGRSSDGEHFTVARYTILIEQQMAGSEQVRLKDNGGNIIGEYSIISIEQLDAVGQTKIIV